jgi:multiple sugar transport system substrate-binding protein
VKHRYTLSVVALFVLTGCGLVPSPSNGTSQGQQITLSYADWGNQALNARLIELFEARYPNITVELRQDIVGSGATFTGNLITAAQAGLLPDVFATDNVPTVIKAGLTLDVAPYWNNDPDAELVYDNIALAGVYNGKRYALPSFQFLKGILLNLDIFEKSNLQTVPGKYRIDNDGYPMKDWTFDEFVNIAKDIKNFDLQNTENLVVGMDTWYGAPDFQQVWPTMQNANTQYDTWDGQQFNYTSPAWISAMQAKVDLHQLTNGTTTRFSDADLNAEENTVLRNNYMIQTGFAAMDIEGSWQFWVIKDVLDRGDFELGFWPYPRGSAGLFPPTILDFQAISSQTQHPEEAYLLAKWMTFGRDGWLGRLSLLEADRDVEIAAGRTPNFLDRFPVADYPDVWTRVNGLVDGLQGIDAIFDRIAFAKPDLDKWLPGYKDFWAWVGDPENPYNWNNLVTEGSTAVPTYALQWQNKINTLVTGELATLGQISP